MLSLRDDVRTLNRVTLNSMHFFIIILDKIPVSMVQKVEE